MYYWPSNSHMMVMMMMTITIIMAIIIKIAQGNTYYILIKFQNISQNVFTYRPPTPNPIEINADKTVKRVVVRVLQMKNIHRKINMKHVLVKYMLTSLTWFNTKGILLSLLVIKFQLYFQFTKVLSTR